MANGKEGLLHWQRRIGRLGISGVHLRGAVGLGPGDSFTTTWRTCMDQPIARGNGIITRYSDEIGHINSSVAERAPISFKHTHQIIIFK